MASSIFQFTGEWTAPTGVTSVTVECWGGGGAGGGDAQTNPNVGGGGAGGAYARKVVSVTPGNTYTVTVGTGGAGNLAADGDAGTASWFSTAGTVYAEGGAGGSFILTGGAGSSAASIGDVVYRGGSGALGVSPSTPGAGGGGAGSLSNGNDASGTTPGAEAYEAGGRGGYASGFTFGGGGGGAYRNDPESIAAGGAGARGLVRITWDEAPLDYSEITADVRTSAPDDTFAAEAPSSDIGAMQPLPGSTGFAANLYAPEVVEPDEYNAGLIGTGWLKSLAGLPEPASTAVAAALEAGITVTATVTGELPTGDTALDAAITVSAAAAADITTAITAAASVTASATTSAALTTAIALVAADTQLFSSDFTGSAGDLGAPDWTQQGNSTVSRNGGGGARTLGTDRAVAWPTLVEFPADQWAEATITAIGTLGANSGVMVRVQTGDANGTERGYGFRTGNSGAAYNLFKYTTSSILLVTTTVIPVVSDRIRIEVFGNRIRGYVNGTLVAETTDNDFATGKPAINFFSTVGTSDDFACGALGPRVVAASTPALTTAIPLASSVAASATTNATLTTSILAAGVLLGPITTAASLTTAIQPAASITATAATAADLTAGGISISSVTGAISGAGRFYHGEAVVVLGTAFGSAGELLVGGYVQSPTSWTSGQIDFTANVPDEAYYNIRVTRHAA